MTFCESWRILDIPYLINALKPNNTGDGAVILFILSGGHINICCFLQNIYKILIHTSMPWPFYGDSNKANARRTTIKYISNNRTRSFCFVGNKKTVKSYWCLQDTYVTYPSFLCESKILENLCVTKMTGEGDFKPYYTMDNPFIVTNFTKSVVCTSRLIGDVLLLTGFLSYSGPFNQEFRTAQQKAWCKELLSRNIPFTPELNLTAMLVDNATVSV